jgi:hypothetical protein
MAFDLDENWLSGDDFEQIRRRVPIVYVNLVPIRVDDGVSSQAESNTENQSERQSFDT